jgi:hypothetical protein
MKLISKEYTVYDLKDLKQDDELCEKIHQKFWIDNANNINPWADENLDSFKEFAQTLILDIDYSLSNAEYPDRGCYIKLIPHYDLDNKDYKELLQDYKGKGYYLCENLKTFTLKLLNKKEYKVLCVEATNDFVLEIQNKMFDLWFADNKDYFSKESFLNDVEANEWQFDADGNLF